MPSISFHPNFLTDLLSGDAQLPARVFRKLLTETGEFRLNRDDHAYHGIKDAWIRVVSRGSSAYRVIYVKTNDHVMFYRAGQHKVEDNLGTPNNDTLIRVSQGAPLLELMRPIGQTVEAIAFGNTGGFTSIEQNEASRFLKNHEKRRLFEQVAGRRLVPHKEVLLVSPYLSLDMMWSTAPMGKALDEWLEDGCTVTLITRPPRATELDEFNKLEARGFEIIYVARLHAKAYLFKVDQTKVNTYQQAPRDLALLGSANLTKSGFHPRGDLDNDPQYELSYEIPAADCEEFENFITHLAAIGIGHEVLRNNTTNQGYAQ